jgi:signal transduction histidine kinase
LSISTKIFLGFAVIIVAFGASMAYSLDRIGQLRENIVFLRQVALPIKEGFLRLEEKLRSYHNEVLDLSAVGVAMSSQRDRLPALQPFREVESLEQRIAPVVERSYVGEETRLALMGVAQSLRRLRQGSEIYQRLATERGTSIDHTPGGPGPTIVTNEEFFEATTHSFVSAVDEHRFDEALTEVKVVRRIVGDVWKGVKVVRRQLDRSIAQSNERAEAEERRIVLTASVSTGAALVVSVIVMVLTQLAIKRVGHLIAGARRISEGHYQEPVIIGGGDEIAQLAGEFNKMAGSLAERDRLLAAQREGLLRAERLATIGRMSAQITHEIRNPLSSIGLNAELLDEELQSGAVGDPSEARSLLRAIAKEIDRLTDVTEQYLRFARLPRPHLEVVQVRQLLEKLVNFTRGELEAREIVLQAELKDVAPVLGDEGQIWQALLNLVRNASEATRPGGRITITLAQDKDRVGLSVRDTGSGIPEEVRERIFEPFFTTKEHGTGLGLALVHQIVSEHGGQIECRSRLGEGTEFVLWLPAAPGGTPA